MESMTKITSNSILKKSPTLVILPKYIQEALFQSCTWYNSCFPEILFLNTLHCGYLLVTKILIPAFETDVLENFPLPCLCQKYAMENVCPCKIEAFLVVNFKSFEVT